MHRDGAGCYITRGRDCTKIVELLTDERCSQAVLVSLATTDAGRTSGPSVAGDGDGEASEASEREYREREKQLVFLREEEERLGAGVIFFGLLLAVGEREASEDLDGSGATHP